MNNSDYLIIGSGIAGLAAAILAAQRGSVTLVTKGFDLRSGSSIFAGAGLSASQDAGSFFSDSFLASHQTSDQESLKFFTEKSWEAFTWLKKIIGVPFFDEALRLPGHTEARVRTAGEHTGEVIVDYLIKKLQILEGVKIVLECRIDTLLTEEILERGARAHHVGDLCVTGASGIKNGGRISFLARHTILATGGNGQHYGITTNPLGSTGDGLSLAKSVGAKISHADRVQWYPFCLKTKRNPAVYLSESLIYFGAFVVNKYGERFLKKYHHDGEFAPLDTISNAIFSEEKNGNGAYLDLRLKPKRFWQARFPQLTAILEQYGLDLEKNLIPISPAVHFFCGGIEVDQKGKTNVSGLFAIGEVSHTGLHGINKLPGNALTEAVVWARACVNGVE